MPSPQQTLFHLLRLALGFPAGETVELSALTKSDWEALVDLAFDQGVAALMVDGLQKVSDGCPFLESEELEDLRYELFGEALLCEEDYRKHLETVRSLVGSFSERELDTYALKGVAFARYYPVPEHRHCGDFDCNVRLRRDGSAAWKLADGIARERGIEVDDSMNKHSRYVVKGLSVENHRHIVSVNGSGRDRRFDAYLQGLLVPKERLLQDVALYVPCSLFDALFCVAHARTHFLLEEGIALRHVIDWVLIRRACGADGQYERFLADIDRFGLRRFFDAFDAVADAVEFGLPAAPGDAGVRRMLDDILLRKEVRHFDKRFLAHLNILRQLWANRWKFRLYCDTSLAATLWRYAYGHWFDRDNL